jgi:hypothetical protein
MMRISLLGMFFYLLCSNVLAATGVPVVQALTSADTCFTPMVSSLPVQDRLWLAGNTENSPATPESGSLVIPGEEEEGKGEKKCMNVCKTWGEDCIINPRTGTRDCRRTCKEFGVECF